MGDDMPLTSSISTSGVLTFDAPPNYEMPMDEGMDNTYEVTVKAEAGGEMDMVDVTVTVTNEDEPGTVTLEPMRPSIGTEIEATLTDLDNVTEDIVMWQWSKSMTMDGTYMDIDTATSMTYTPVADDNGSYLKAMASYTDGEGSGKVDDEMTGTPVSLYVIDGPASRSYMENGTDAVATYIASGDAATTWTLAGDDAGDFTITGGMLTFNDAPDFEAPAYADGGNTYMVTVKANVGTYMDTQDVMVMVTNVDEMGEVTLWAGMDALTMAPQVGDTITGAVMDPDGGVTGETWQWSRTMDTADMSSWMDIQDATDAAYMVTAGDAGYYLRVMATYTDAAGTDMAMEYSPATMMVGAEAGDTLLGRYDENGNDEIDLDEVFTAIDDYFEERLTLEEVFEIIDLYFES